MLKREEWDFGWVNKLDQYGLVKCCHDYEFSREIPGDIKKAIVAYRKGAASPDFKGLLDSFVGNGANWICPEFLSVPGVAG